MPNSRMAVALLTHTVAASALAGQSWIPSERRTQNHRTPIWSRHTAGAQQMARATLRRRGPLSGAPALHPRPCPATRTALSDRQEDGRSRPRGSVCFLRAPSGCLSHGSRGRKCKAGGVLGESQLRAPDAGRDPTGSATHALWLQDRPPSHPSWSRAGDRRRQRRRWGQRPPVRPQLGPCSCVYSGLRHDVFSSHFRHKQSPVCNMMAVSQIPAKHKAMSARFSGVWV